MLGSVYMLFDMAPAEQANKRGRQPSSQTASQLCQGNTCLVDSKLDAWAYLGGCGLEKSWGLPVLAITEGSTAGRATFLASMAACPCSL